MQTLYTCLSGKGGRFAPFGMGERTHLLQLLQHLVVLPPQLRPLGKLILAARSVQVMSHLEVTLLELALVADLLRGAQRGRDVELP
jgi:hypothetical protein